MKITAEFNSNEELLNFINAFGTKSLITGQTVNQVAKETVTASKSESKKEAKKENAEKVSAKGDKKEDSKITKEMVRAIFTKLIKAGKAKEAKELTKKYGANRIPEIKEENYETIYKEAEELL